MLDQTSNADIETIPIPEAEAMEIEELHRLVKMGNATLTSADGLHQLELPDPLYRLLLRIIGDVAEGRPIVYAPATQDLTTQQTANLLGMSRQFLVGLLDKGEIPYHRVGTHRRLMFKDVMAFRKLRDQRRHEALNQMAKEAVESGHYDEF
jgi:excisionase family DNA binding protein